MASTHFAVKVFIHLGNELFCISGLRIYLPWTQSGGSSFSLTLLFGFLLLHRESPVMSMAVSPHFLQARQERLETMSQTCGVLDHTKIERLHTEKDITLITSPEGKISSL